MTVPIDLNLARTLKQLRERPAPQVTCGDGNPEGQINSGYSPFEARLEGFIGDVDGAMPTVHPDDVLAQLDDVITRMPAGEVGDPDAFKHAYHLLLQHGEPALRKILRPLASPIPEILPDEIASLEAVIIADGTRPSFLLREGNVAPDHPFLGFWRDDMTAFQPALRKLSACVGRIQPVQGGPGRFNGTGVLVDATELLVLTNFHVVQHARNVSDVAMVSDGNRLNVKGDWFIDFVGEVDSAKTNTWKVKEVRLPANAGVSFAGVDAAVLRIEPITSQESQLPEPAIVLSGDLNYATGAGAATLATIGYPGAPDTQPRKGVTVDWNFVTKTLFNNLFGLKRVAPGKFDSGVGTVSGDLLGHVLSHDATTFGGASGSPVFAWMDEKSPVFALHFAGHTQTANYAVSLHKTREVLHAIGVPIA